MKYFVNSAINHTWKLCILGGFLVLFLLSLLLTKNSLTFRSVSHPSSTTVVEFIVSDSSDQHTTFPAAAPPPAVVVASAPPSSITTGAEIEHDIPTNAFHNPSEAIESIFNSTSKEKISPPSAALTPLKAAENTVVVGVERKCKIYEGRWVYKPEENPRYHVNQCPFLEEKMSCQKNGRSDFEYEGWSWEANDCKIPLFSGRKMLKRLRGKRVIIAGDSLNRNQWESLACLLYTSVRPRQAKVNAHGAYKFLKAKDYNFTLEFYWAPFLVHLDQKKKSGRKVVVLDKLVPSSKRWRGADVMVFNTGHWWTHSGKIQAWDMLEYKGHLVEEMEREVAYERALSTWAHWISHNVDPAKTKVFFRSISPEHKSKDSCFNASRPITDESYEQIYPQSMINVVERKMKEMEGRVKYLNITKLSSYRRDAHPCMYTSRDWKTMGEESKRSCDCSHWCLPGLPDTWSRLLYAALFFDNLSFGDLTN